MRTLFAIFAMILATAASAETQTSAERQLSNPWQWIQAPGSKVVWLNRNAIVRGAHNAIAMVYIADKDTDSQPYIDTTKIRVIVIECTPKQYTYAQFNRPDDVQNASGSLRIVGDISCGY